MLNLPRCASTAKSIADHLGPLHDLALEVEIDDFPVETRIFYRLSEGFFSVEMIDFPNSEDRIHEAEITRQLNEQTGCWFEFASLASADTHVL